MKAELVELYRHNTWANVILVDFCAALPAEHAEARIAGTYGTPRDTLWHIAANECGYLSMWGEQIGPPPGAETSFPGWDALRARFAAAGEAFVRIASRLQPDDVLRGEFQGRPYEMPAVVPLMQAINHGTEHRAHVVTTLSARGVEAPTLDAWTYWQQATAGGP